MALCAVCARNSKRRLLTCFSRNSGEPQIPSTSDAPCAAAQVARAAPVSAKPAARYEPLFDGGGQLVQCIHRDPVMGQCTNRVLVTVSEQGWTGLMRVDDEPW